MAASALVDAGFLVALLSRCDAVKCSFVPGAYSITSSAVICMIGGMARLSAFAVFRLITNWNLVGCSTGRSAAFSPLRMRAT